MPFVLAAVTLVFAQITVPALRPGEWVIDELEPGTIRGYVVDPIAGVAVAGMPVRLSRTTRTAKRTWPEPWVPAEPGAASREIASVATDRDGRFEFRGVAPGLYRLKTTGALRAPVTTETVISHDEPTREVRIEVEMGARVLGQALDQNGAPLADFPVRLVGVDFGDGLNSLPKDVRVGTRTEVDGTFALDGLPTGTVYLQAARRNYGYSSPVAVAVRSGGSITDITFVVPDESERLALNRSGDGGIGVRLDFVEVGPRIVSLLPGMAAEAVGLQAGDVLAQIDGRPTRFMAPREFVDRCRGPLGTSVAIGVDRDGEVLDFELVRAAFPEDDR